MILQRCCDCKETKPITEFTRNRSKKSGYTYSCKMCERVRGRKRYWERKEFMKERPNLFGFLDIPSRTRPVAQYTKDGVFVKRFESSKLAADELGINSMNIHRAAKSLRLTAAGFRWKYIVNTDVGEVNGICQHCGKLCETDILAKISLECLRDLKEGKRNSL